MATTQSLNSDDSIEVVTFSGGNMFGRCYEFKDRLNQRELVLTEQQLLGLIETGQLVTPRRRTDVRVWV